MAAVAAVGAVADVYPRAAVLPYQLVEVEVVLYVLHQAAVLRRVVGVDVGGLPGQVLKFLLGIIGIVWGANLLIENGSALAEAMGVPSAIIGVTVIAVGTSLPELVTTITAIVKRESALSIGNIIGANVIDLTMILPICSILSGGSLTISAQGVGLDLPACFAIILLGILPPLIGGKFYRWQGAAMLAAYAAYVAILVR